MTFDPNDPSTDRRSLSRRGGERRSGVDRRLVHAESHPPISDPSHPDHAEWQHEFVDAPAPADVAALTEAAQKARYDEEVARVASAEASAANTAEQAAAAQAPVEPQPVDPAAPVTPEPVVEPAQAPVEPAQ